VSRAGQPEPKRSRTPIAVVIPVRNRRFWVQLRRESGSLDKCWEFPGGKVQPDESPRVAACREMAEETGILTIATALEPVVTVDHDYSDRCVRIHFFKLEQDLDLKSVAGRWVTPEELLGLPIPDANRAAIARIMERW
jgi:8-oxo-dGTP diphosphatase